MWVFLLLSPAVSATTAEGVPGGRPMMAVQLISSKRYQRHWSVEEPRWDCVETLDGKGSDGFHLGRLPIDLPQRDASPVTLFKAFDDAFRKAGLFDLDTVTVNGHTVVAGVTTKGSDCVWQEYEPWTTKPLGVEAGTHDAGPFVRALKTRAREMGTRLGIASAHGKYFVEQFEVLGPHESLVDILSRPVRSGAKYAYAVRWWRSRRTWTFDLIQIVPSDAVRAHLEATKEARREACINGLFRNELPVDKQEACYDEFFRKPSQR